MNESRSTAWDTVIAAYDVDQRRAVPQALRLRTTHLLALFVGAVSIGAAIELPRAWQLVALGDLAATSLFFALAAGREWFLRYRPAGQLAGSRLVGVVRHGLEYRAVGS